MIDEELLPCPFCGKAPNIDEFHHQTAGVHWIICCNNDACTETVVDEKTREKAVAKWNTRADNVGSIHSRVRELERALRVAEATLADIGDADREPGDDLAWCERRAEQALPTVRKTLASRAPKEQEQHTEGSEYETRADGKRVRKDRWETGFRNIVSILVGPRQGFEIDEIVEQVRTLSQGNRENVEARGQSDHEQTLVSGVRALADEMDHVAAADLANVPGSPGMRDALNEYADRMRKLL